MNLSGFLKRPSLTICKVQLRREVINLLFINFMIIFISTRVIWASDHFIMVQRYKRYQTSKTYTGFRKCSQRMMFGMMWYFLSSLGYFGPRKICSLLRWWERIYFGPHFYLLGQDGKNVGELSSVILRLWRGGDEIYHFFHGNGVVAVYTQYTSQRRHKNVKIFFLVFLFQDLWIINYPQSDCIS